MTVRVELLADRRDPLQAQTARHVFEPAQHHLHTVRHCGDFGCVRHRIGCALEVIDDGQNFAQCVFNGAPSHLLDLFARPLAKIVEISRDSKQLLSHPVPLGAGFVEVARLLLGGLSRRFLRLLVCNDHVLIAARGILTVFEIVPLVLSHVPRPCWERFDGPRFRPSSTSLNRLAAKPTKGTYFL
jgi:hypothetical protein